MPNSYLASARDSRYYANGKSISQTSPESFKNKTCKWLHSTYSAHFPRVHYSAPSQVNQSDVTMFLPWTSPITKKGERVICRGLGGEGEEKLLQ
ncbi:hypothetical protein VNO80_11666 [Phaseolus coccineus]|uniref:Uncharacterized protein n=1 Tax=Phaseolus coccineus TaxID=3886 RepID=A0AAN9NFQ8_PHACN